MSPIAMRQLSPADRRTIDAIFRHPVARNLAWSDVLHLMRRVGTVEHGYNGKFRLAVGGHEVFFARPNGKHLDPGEIMQLRSFLHDAGAEAGFAEVDKGGRVPEGDMLVAVDHRGARLFWIGAQSPAGTLHPYDPHHYLHHLDHRIENHYRGQRAPEDGSYYDGIAAALAGARRIVLIGHGSAKSNAARHLEGVLRKKYSEIYARVAVTESADLSAMTEPQLLALALEALAKDPHVRV